MIHFAIIVKGWNKPKGSSTWVIKKESIFLFVVDVSLKPLIEYCRVSDCKFQGFCYYMSYHSGLLINPHVNCTWICEARNLLNSWSFCLMYHVICFFYGITSSTKIIHIKNFSNNLTYIWRAYFLFEATSWKKGWSCSPIGKLKVGISEFGSGL